MTTPASTAFPVPAKIVSDDGDTNTYRGTPSLTTTKGGAK